jgi:hypothetical protein
MDALIATTDAEREAIYQHRYRVYVEELGRYADLADHEGRRLVDPEDDQSDLVYIADGDQVVASLRNSWGGNGFSQRQIDAFSLAPFLADLPPEVLVVGERTMIAPSHRGLDLYSLLAAKSAEGAGSNLVRIAFGSCEPHLIRFYGEYMRPYAARNINHPDSGYQIPLITFVHGLDALRGVGAPASQLATSVEHAAASTGAVLCSHLTDPDEYLSTIARFVDQTPTSVLADVRGELPSILSGSNVITCTAGDILIRHGGTTHTLYVILQGATTDGSTAGAALGHSSALEMTKPEGDVTISSDDTRVLALSERTLRSLPTKVRDRLACGTDPERSARR